MFFRSDKTYLSASAKRPHELLVRQQIQLLLDLSVDVLFARYSKNVHQPGFPDIAIHNLSRKANVVQQPGQLSGCMWKIVLSFDYELFYGYQIAGTSGERCPINCSHVILLVLRVVETGIMIALPKAPDIGKSERKR
jgi:hypothetical protein